MEAAQLTGALLSIKGRATATGFKPGRARKSASLHTAWTASEAKAGPDERLPPARCGENGDGPAAAEPAPEATASTAGDSVKLSLRLDESRHLRLKLAAAHQRRSAQQILVGALDRYLAELAPCAIGRKCACLAQTDEAAAAADAPGD